MTGEAISNESKYLVSTEWLAEHLGAPGLAIVDASWHLPTADRSGRAEFLERHIPGAVFFDIDAIADKNSSLPHMLPDPVAFSSAVRKLGIGDGMKIVVYDSLGLFSAARVWWTFRAFGVRDVVVLDGGLPKWLAEGRPTDEGEALPKSRHFTARLDHALIASLEDVRDASANIGAPRLAGPRPRRSSTPALRRASAATSWSRAGLAVRPYSRQPQPALERLADRGTAASAGRTGHGFFSRRLRSGQADHRHLRLRRVRGDLRPGHGLDRTCPRRGL